MRHFSGSLAFSCRITAVFLCFILPFSVAAESNIERNMAAIEKLQNNTAPLIDEALSNVSEYEALTERLSERFESTGSGLMALRVAKIDKRIALAKSNLALAERYIEKYKTFLNDVDPESACYRPELVSDFYDRIQALDDLSTTILTFKTITEEDKAKAAVVQLGMHGVGVAEVPGTFVIANACFLEDAAPVLEAFFGDMSGEEFANLAELAESEGMLEPLPGDLWQDDEALEEGMDALAPLSQPIDDVVFSDPEMEACVSMAAQVNEATRVNDLSTLLCDLPINAKIRLDDLASFPGLEVVTLSGVEVESLSPLNEMPALSQVLIEQSTISSFGDMSNVQADLVFSEVDAEDWGALAQSESGRIYIEQPSDCRSLSSLVHSGAVSVIFSDGEGQLDAQGMSDSVNADRVVITDCTRDSVN
ncbi:hypothetical protein [Enterovibrio baiacu]|uniref:hypothetical protein n=1 Tax=Enterovibrio baiacu TaxID=2491023 RepID=UPI001011CC1A|nr:hypothetical protein [Enterovibrio baiacu]MBE1276800.1 hypothetical protein [Enterovibrio baiacu]